MLKAIFTLCLSSTAVLTAVRAITIPLPANSTLASNYIPIPTGPEYFDHVEKGLRQMALSFPHVSLEHELYGIYFNRVVSSSPQPANFTRDRTSTTIVAIEYQRGPEGGWKVLEVGDKYGDTEKWDHHQDPTTNPQFEDALDYATFKQAGLDLDTAWTAVLHDARVRKAGLPTSSWQVNVKIANFRSGSHSRHKGSCLEGGIYYEFSVYDDKMHSGIYQVSLDKTVYICGQPQFEKSSGNSISTS